MTPITIQARQSKGLGGGEADAPAPGGGRVQRPRLTRRQPEGQKDWAMKMKDGSPNGGAVMVGTEGRGGGGVRGGR